MAGRLVRGVCVAVVMAGLVTPAAATEGADSLEPLTPWPTAETGQAVDESGHLWFVELASPPLADGGDGKTVRNEKAAFRAAARKVGVTYSERHSFDRLWNGLSISVARTQLTKLSSIPGVRALYPVGMATVPETPPTADPTLATALEMTGADVAQDSLGLTGAGVKVAVMDTGIDHHHPDLGGCFGPGCRVATGWDFVGDAYDASTNPVTTPAPDADPDDCNGHGTHVAGIVGANGAVQGVAPGVTFGAYRVFGCNGSTSIDVMIAAMERALADDMDVLNMSIGRAFTWPNYPSAQAATRLVNAGVVVVASTGNSGATGLYSAGAPGVGAKVIGVASMDNTHLLLPYFTVSADDARIAYTRATGAPPPPTSGSSPMARTGTTSSSDDACAPLAAGSLSGKVALIRRGGCTFYTKVINAQNAGAAGVVIYDNVPGQLTPTVEAPDSPPVNIPVVGITAVDGTTLDSRLSAGAVTMTWTAETASFPNATGGLVSPFSSYGLAPDLSLKPDLSAPGGFIRSTYPIELGSYETLSGTSMSSPHVAGAAALLLQARPRTPANAVKGIFQNSADPAPWWGNPGLGFLDVVHRQGAGLIDIDEAIQGTSTISPSNLALGESEAGPATRTMTLSNSSADPVTYELSHGPALSTGGDTFSPSFFTGFSGVTFSVAGVPVTSIVVPADGTSAVDVTITANTSLSDRSLYGGYLVFTPQGGETPLRVPYAGLKGDYQSLTVLTPTPQQFPWLARFTADGVANEPNGATFSMQADDVPVIVAHFEHQSRLVRMEVTDVATGANKHRALQLPYFGRNATSSDFFTFAWDGTTTHGQKATVLPDGQYRIKLTVVKALGDASNPAHVETWTSPVITIDRP